MLTRLRIKNFKKFEDVDIELGSAVVFVGPNNSGKTTALQALTLWQHGIRKYLEKRGPGAPLKKRPGVTINRRDLYALPVGLTSYLWKDKRVRTGERSGGKTITQNVLIEMVVEGISNGSRWECGLEFDYANEESLYCRPLATDVATDERMPVPIEAGSVNVAFLPPMSGLTAFEDKLEKGSIDERIGQGRTAEVLRNLCHQVYLDDRECWKTIVDDIKNLFGDEINDPLYVGERGKIEISYTDHASGTRLDLSSAGRGLQQTLLLMTWLHAHPGSVLLIDEPDAHLEILRQQQIYNLLTQTAQKTSGQIIAASHSEVVLNEAAGRDIVVAFVGSQPHRIDDRGNQVLKSLRSIGYEEYHKAELKGWVLYLEGSTDLAVLKAFADKLGHPVSEDLKAPFVHYIGNTLAKAAEHYFGLKEAKRDLRGIVLLDRQVERKDVNGLEVHYWKRNEIENYLCQPETLREFARSLSEGRGAGPLFAHGAVAENVAAMDKSIRNRTPPAALADPSDSYWQNVKASDELLGPVFNDFFRERQMPNVMPKSNYHRLAPFVPEDLLDNDVREKLDAIRQIAATRSRTNE